MNPNKLIAGAIFLFLFLVPFRMLFFTDEIISSFGFIGLLLVNIIGFFVAFAIGTNEPFGRRKKAQQQQVQSESVRKAA